MENDIDAGRLRLCFGSKKLWRAQHSLEANGYADHAEWLTDWRDARGNEFFVLGSRMRARAASSASLLSPMTAH